MFRHHQIPFLFLAPWIFPTANSHTGRYFAFETSGSAGISDMEIRNVTAGEDTPTIPACQSGIQGASAACGGRITARITA